MQTLGGSVADYMFVSFSQDMVKEIDEMIEREQETN